MIKESSPSPRRARPSQPWRVLIVNGLAVWREALTHQINRSRDLMVCGVASGETAAFQMVRRLRPGLVLTEILHPPNLSFIRKLHRRHPRLKILTFSCQEETAYARRALAAGAKGYLMKDAGGDRLVAAIREVLRGKVVLSPAMDRQLRRQED